MNREGGERGLRVREVKNYRWLVSVKAISPAVCICWQLWKLGFSPVLRCWLEQTTNCFGSQVFFFFLFFPGNHIKGARAVLGKLEIMLRVSSSVYRTRLSPSGDEGSEEPR